MPAALGMEPRRSRMLWRRSSERPLTVRRPLTFGGHHGDLLVATSVWVSRRFSEICPRLFFFPENHGSYLTLLLAAPLMACERKERWNWMGSATGGLHRPAHVTTIYLYICFFTYDSSCGCTPYIHSIHVHLKMRSM